jgi:hypothetical protein
MNTPANEKIKKNNISNIITLSKEGIEKTIVLIIACKSSALPNSLMTLVTRSTLSNLAICGPTVRASTSAGSSKARMTSKIDAKTTKKSNLFQASEK